MENNASSPAHTPAPWFTQPIEHGSWLIILEDGSCIASVGDGPHEGNPESVAADARLIAETPNLLRIAESAANAFEERISCLQDELLEDFCDADDVMDQIGNYQCLLDQHRKVIARARGKAI
jgi:hypothetical protein